MCLCTQVVKMHDWNKIFGLIVAFEVDKSPKVNNRQNNHNSNLHSNTVEYTGTWGKWATGQWPLSNLSYRFKHDFTIPMPSYFLGRTRNPNFLWILATNCYWASDHSLSAISSGVNSIYVDLEIICSLSVKIFAVTVRSLLIMGTR